MKHLISLIDGTSVSAATGGTSAPFSNVFKINCLIDQSDSEVSDPGRAPQIVFYSSGISSLPDEDSTFNELTGNTIKSQIIEQYINLCSNFDFDGLNDRIYLFGYSRGAMAIRALAGIISEFGLLRPQQIHELPALIDAWENGVGDQEISEDIRQKPVAIEFIGLFDSVMGGIRSSGIFNPIKFSNHVLPINCKSAVHLLSIDEDRSYFEPVFWEGSSTTDQFLRQVWMPGTHGDVGGSCAPIWGSVALVTMIHYLTSQTNLRLFQQDVEDTIALARNALGGSGLVITAPPPISAVTRLFSSSGAGRQYGKVASNQIRSAGHFFHPICRSLHGRRIRYKDKQNYGSWFGDVFRRSEWDKLPEEVELCVLTDRITKAKKRRA